MPKEQLKAVLKVKNGQIFIENRTFLPRPRAGEHREQASAESRQTPSSIVIEIVIEIALSYMCWDLYEHREQSRQAPKSS